MDFPIFLWFSHGFPIVSLWVSYKNLVDLVGFFLHLGSEDWTMQKILHEPLDINCSLAAVGVRLFIIYIYIYVCICICQDSALLHIVDHYIIYTLVFNGYLNECLHLHMYFIEIYIYIHYQSNKHQAT